MYLKKHLSEFNEVTVLLQELKVIKSQNIKIRRKLKTILKKYSFLEDLVCIDGNDEIIVNALVKYFKELGFPNIKNVGKNFMEEDLRLIVKDRLIIFEATGTKNQTNKEEKVHQISKFIPIRKKQYPLFEVSGVFVTNHDNKNPYNLRHKKPFDKRIIKIAIAHGYTLTTSTDLLYFFIDIKKGLLKSDEFIDKLCNFGELKYKGN
jgi:hypothetical protein